MISVILYIGYQLRFYRHLTGNQPTTTQALTWIGARDVLEVVSKIPAFITTFTFVDHCTQSRSCMCLVNWNVSISSLCDRFCFSFWKKTQFFRKRRPLHNLIPIPHQDEKEQIILETTFLPQTSPDHLSFDILKKGDFVKLVVFMFQNCCYIRHVEWVSTFDEIRFWRIRIQHQILFYNTSLSCLQLLDPSALWAE